MCLRSAVNDVLAAVTYWAAHCLEDAGERRRGARQAPLGFQAGRSGSSRSMLRGNRRVLRAACERGGEVADRAGRQTDGPTAQRRAAATRSLGDRGTAGGF